MQVRSLPLQACWLAIALAGAAHATGADHATGAEARIAKSGDEARVHATLLVDREPGAHEARVGVLFEMAPGWHLYWRNPGDSGLPPVLRFDFGAADVTVGELRWPVPRAFAEDDDVLTFGYEDRVLLAAPVRWDGRTRVETVRVSADVLVCSNQCVPATFELAHPLYTPESRRGRVHALFEQAARLVPSSAREHGIGVALDWTGPGPDTGAGAGFAATLTVTPCPAGRSCPLEAPARPPGAFFPYAPDSLQVHPVAIERSGSTYRIALRGVATAPLEAGARLRGVLVLRDAAGGTKAFETSVPLTPSGGAPAEADASLATLLRALALGVLGGLLLNLMPCVLPVLAIKVCAMAELAQRDRREVVAHAIAYTAGVLVTLTALALCVVALRWSGTAVGWGFQLQEPVFVAVVAAVLVAFAMNLVGAFEFEVAGAGLARLGASAAGARRSFFDGLLAVVLSTPCSAPFLGTAVGFAFASSAPVIVAIFLAIGAGLAAPFVAVSIAPGWTRWLPRSGGWMLELRRGLGFALLATVVWLVWIVGRISGTDAMAELLMLLLAVAFTSYLFGLLQRRRRAHGMLLFAAIAGLLLAGLDRVELHTAPPPPDRDPSLAHAATAEAPLPYSREALAQALAEGRPVFVYFTADWCLTCKLNEHRVLEQPQVEEALSRRGFVVLRGDWTRRDETVRRELARLGKAGVPVYALYAPGAPDSPRLLPELLRLEPFLNALAETADEARSADARRTAGDS